jgi:hypothetical protein
MTLSGSLSELSLPEIFQFLDLGKKTGLLTIRDLRDLHTGKSLARHIWLQNGRIVAAGTSLDHRGLFRLIEKKGWVTEEFRPEFERLIKENEPLGKNLRHLGILKSEQLKSLFGIQVVREIFSLLSLQAGMYRFDEKKDVPNSETTGLSLSANEITLMGLRGLKDWRSLQGKLPKQGSTLFAIIPGQPHLRLDEGEKQVMDSANGSMNLLMIAEKLQLPIQEVLQISFRLIMVGLVDELPDPNGDMSSFVFTVKTRDYGNLF